MVRSFKFRIYPTNEQKILMSKTFGCCRFIWNKMLSDKVDYYEKYKSNLKVNPTDYKNEFPWLKEVDAHALCATWMNLNNAYKRFFNNSSTSFPKFKSKKNSKQSYTTNFSNNNIELIENKYLKLPKLKLVRIKLHRRLPDNYNIKNVAILRTSTNKYYASITVEYTFEIPVIELNLENSIGLDYKSNGLFIDNQGNQPNYPKYFRLHEDKLAREQRKLSHMKLGSNNYKKQKLKIAKIHEKIANQRLDFLHKFSYDIVNKYDYIFVEDINLQSISQFGHLGKSTNDNSFGIFRTLLSYKMKDRGKVFHKIDKWFPSSKICSSCGSYHKDIVNDLSVRDWVCPDCGTHHDRDINAARNIRACGINDIIVGATRLAC